MVYIGHRNEAWQSSSRQIDNFFEFLFESQAQNYDTFILYSIILLCSAWTLLSTLHSNLLSIAFKRWNCQKAEKCYKRLSSIKRLLSKAVKRLSKYMKAVKLFLYHFYLLDIGIILSILYSQGKSDIGTIWLNPILV